MAAQETILITGGSGFIGSHCILQALQKGYTVRTTIRSLTRAEQVRAALTTGGATPAQVASVQFHEADLLKDDGWAAACAGCTYVLHVASPFPSTVPKDENELIAPAREGTLRALRAARAAGTVKRVVVTSSVAAIMYGQTPGAEPFTEADWTDLANPAVPVSAYPKSKTLAERAAWDFIQTEAAGSGMELSVVNPVAVYGPVLSGDFATSVELVLRLIKGQVPACPRLVLGVVDVRDVAALHLLAMTAPAAAGQRYIATAGSAVSVLEIAKMLKASAGADALPPHIKKKLPSREVPDFLLRALALFDPTVAMVVPELGKRKDASNDKARRELGWAPRDAAESVVSCAKSLLEVGSAK